MEKFIVIGVIIFVIAALFGGGQSDKTKPRNSRPQKEPPRQRPPEAKKPEKKTPCGYVCAYCGNSTTATAPPSYGCSCGQFGWQARY